MKTRLFCIVCLLVFFWSASLYSQKIEEKNGIKYVRNDKEGIWNKAKKPQLELKFIRSWGETESDDDNFMFYDPSDVAMDLEGNVYIADAGNNRIQKFDSEGNYIRTYGREGQGPGEFKMPADIEIDKEGNIYVADAGNRRLQILNNEGEYLNGFVLEKGVGEINVDSNNNIYISAGGMVMITMGAGGSEKPPEEPLITCYDNEGNIIGDIGKKESYKDPMVFRRANQFISDIDGAGNLFLSYRFVNKIEKYDKDGNLICVIDRDLKFKPKDIEDIDPRNFADIDGISYGIAVDNNDRVFVVTAQRPEKQEEKGELKTVTQRSGNEMRVVARMSYDQSIVNTDRFALEVYNNDGVLLTSVQLDKFVNDIRIFGNKLFIVDTNRSMKIYEYEIICKDV